MTLHGKIQNGVVVLDGPVSLPDGTEVFVQPVESMGEKPWMKCVGTISEEDAMEMLRYVENTCERIEPEEKA